MQRYDDLASVPVGFASAVTIGKFDGVHVGHRAIITRLQQAAAERGLQPVVVTFDRNPLSVVRPEFCPPDLNSLEQKVELLEDAGVEHVYVVHFTKEVSAEEPEAWLEETIVRGLGARFILVGPDFRFGHRGRGDVAMLQALAEQHGYEVELLPDVLVDGERVSSTRIRTLLDEGALEQAKALLGRAPYVTGEVVHGDHRGRELGVPTANLAPMSEGFMPGDGIYAGLLQHGDRQWPAAISVGTNPSFDGVTVRRIEAHAIGADADLDLYGEQVTVTFVQQLRGMVAFSNIDDLIAQMQDDIAQTVRIIGELQR